MLAYKFQFKNKIKQADHFKINAIAVTILMLTLILSQNKCNAIGKDESYLTRFFFSEGRTFHIHDCTIKWNYSVWSDS